MAGSLADSVPIGCSSEDETQFYKSKLESIMQIMSNKDEMLKIRAESIQLAEERISSLSERNTQLKAELERKIVEARKGSDVTVTKMKNNISVMENLYRDSFYESAKQAEMVETLRNSYLEVRQSSAEKCEEICRLQGIIVSQKWDLEKCQNIADELESLKSEIANVLNNANNDSGMWERSEDSLQNEICQELNEITGQLLQLKHILHMDCNCDIIEENKLLKRTNEQLNADLSDLKCRIEELKNLTRKNDETIELYIQQLKENETEMGKLSNTVRESELCREGLLRDKKQLLREREELCQRECQLRSALEERTAEITANQKCISGLKDGMRNVKFNMKCKTAECERLTQLCKNYENALKSLKEETSSAEVCKTENLKLRSEVSYLNNQLVMWQSEVSESGRRTKELEALLAAACSAYQELQDKFRDKSESAARLESELAEASTRGTELCAESRHVVSGVRHWMRRMRQQHQVQQNTIEQLQRKLEEERQHRMECGGRLSEGYCNTYPEEHAYTDNRDYYDKRQQRCSVERFLTDGESSTGSGACAYCSPSPAPLYTRLSPCRSCETFRCPGRAPRAPGNMARASTDPGSPPTTPSEYVKMSLDNTRNNYRSENLRRPANTKTYRSVKTQHT